MCYTTNEYVKLKTEVTYSTQFPYGSDGYRTDCNNIPVSWLPADSGYEESAFISGFLSLSQNLA